MMAAFRKDVNDIQESNNIQEEILTFMKESAADAAVCKKTGSASYSDSASHFS